MDLIQNHVYCKIADLLVELPARGGVASLCGEYPADASSSPDIVIREEEYRNPTGVTVSEELLAYMESGVQFYRALLRFDGMMLHASALSYGGKAYLFSGPSGVGKSTHTRLWQDVFGEDVEIINDDKPALRRLDGRWYAYGTPWSGKHHINKNRRLPLCGICFLKQADENRIRRVSSLEAIQLIVPQTVRKRLTAEEMARLLSHVDVLIREIPIFELENCPEPAAARLSLETMRRAASELGI